MCTMQGPRRNQIRVGEGGVMITGLVIFMLWELDLKGVKPNSGLSTLIIAPFVFGVIQDFCLILWLIK